MNEGGHVRGVSNIARLKVKASADSRNRDFCGVGSTNPGLLGGMIELEVPGWQDVELATENGIALKGPDIAIFDLPHVASRCRAFLNGSWIRYVLEQRSCTHLGINNQRNRNSFRGVSCHRLDLQTSLANLPSVSNAVKIGETSRLSEVS